MSETRRQKLAFQIAMVALLAFFALSAVLAWSLSMTRELASQNSAQDQDIHDLRSRVMQLEKQLRSQP